MIVLIDYIGIFVVTYYQFDKKTMVLINNVVTYYILRDN